MPNTDIDVDGLEAALSSNADGYITFREILRHAGIGGEPEWRAILSAAITAYLSALQPTDAGAGEPAPEDIPELLDRYWDLAYAEGKEGRDHDTPNGDAQETRTKLNLAFIAGMRPASPEAGVAVGKPGAEKQISAAIFDPGAEVGMKHDRTLTEWQTDAVMNVLTRLDALASPTVADDPRPGGHVKTAGMAVGEPLYPPKGTR